MAAASGGAPLGQTGGRRRLSRAALDIPRGARIGTVAPDAGRPAGRGLTAGTARAACRAATRIVVRRGTVLCCRLGWVLADRPAIPRAGRVRPPGRDVTWPSTSLPATTRRRR